MPDEVIIEATNELLAEEDGGGKADTSEWHPSSFAWGALGWSVATATAIVLTAGAIVVVVEAGGAAVVAGAALRGAPLVPAFL